MIITIKSQPDLDFIKHGFSKDVDLINKFHIIAPSSEENCAKNTYDVLVSGNVDMYKMFDVNDNIVGWFGKEGESNLTGFFIMPEFRTYQPVWDCILSNFKKPTRTSFYLKNYRAIKALQKQGFKIINTNASPSGLAVTMEI